MGRELETRRAFEVKGPFRLNVSEGTMVGGGIGSSI